MHIVLYILAILLKQGGFLQIGPISFHWKLLSVTFFAAFTE